MAEEPPKPIGLGTDIDPAAFVSPAQQLGRPDGMRIVPSGVDDPSRRICEDTAYPLANFNINVLEKHRNIDVIENLWFPGETHEEHVMSAISRVGTPKKRGGEIDTTQMAFTGAHLDDDNPLSSYLVEEAGSHLPPEVGLERCSVEFSPLGLTPVSTFRLLLGKNREQVNVDFLKINPLAWSITALADAGLPHLAQTLVSRQSNGDGYLASVRFAVLTPENALATDDDFLEHMSNPSYHGLESIWQQTGLKSNFDLPISDFYREVFNTPWRRKRKYMEWSHSETARELYEGKEEFNELLRGRSGYDELYSRVVGYPRMPVNPYGLQFLTAFIPRYFDDGTPWDNVEHRAAPTVSTRDVHRSAPGTDQPLGEVDRTMRVRPKSTGLTAGGKLHQELLAWTIQYYLEAGRQAEELDQSDHESIPDAVIVDVELVRYLEIEVANKTAPANLLTNVARARYEGRPVTIVTNSKSHAESVRDLLIEPYRWTTDHGVRTYNLKTDPVTFDDGSQPVLPKGADEAEWYLDVDGTVRLIIDGEVLAEGPADEPTASYAFETLRYVEADTHQIRDDNDEVIVEYDSHGAFTNDWTLVRPPCVPPDHYLLEDVEIRYKSGNELVTLAVAPEWYRTAGSSDDRYSGGLRAFIDLYTREVGDGEIEYTAYREAYKEWYTALTPPPHDGSAHEPSDNRIGVVRPDSVETKRRKVDGEWVRFVRDWDWVFPRGLWSPDFPFVDEDKADDAETAADDAGVTEVWGDDDDADANTADS